MLYWAVHFVEKGEVIGTIDYLADEMTVYLGMFDVPSYCVWYVAPDKAKEIYIGLQFRLMLHQDNVPVFYNVYDIKNIIYDVHIQKFRIYAESWIYGLLEDGQGIPAHVWSSNKSQPISGDKIIKEVVKDISMGLVDVITQEPLGSLVKYASFSFDPEFSVLDLITKICRENLWEWYLVENKILISEALVEPESFVTFTETDWQSKKFIDNVSFSHVTLSADACEPGIRFGEHGRVIWVKYHVGGEIGDDMSFMVYNYIDKHITRSTYFETLQGISRDLAFKRTLKNYAQSPIITGKIYDDLSSTNISKYEAKTFGGDVRNYTKDLNTLEFKTKYVGTEQKVIGADNVKISTPYAGDGVGILYPTEESHRVLFSPDGDREMPIVGPAYFGFNDRVPKRDSAKDFRLQLPGGTIIVTEGGEMFLSPDGEMSITVGGIDPTNTAEPVSHKILVTSSGIDIKDSSGVHILSVDGSSVSIGTVPTLKVTPGEVKIIGNLKVQGMFDAIMVEGKALVRGTGPPLKAKIPPG